MIDPKKHQQDWDRYIPFATAAYRATVHETTQETPNMMMFGCEVTHSLDLAFDSHDTELNTDYAQDLRNRMDDIYLRVTKQTDKNMRRQKRNYDKHTNDKTYSVGNYVWLRNDFRKKGTSPKLTNRWDGPFRVITKLSDVTYRPGGVKSTLQKYTTIYLDCHIGSLTSWNHIYPSLNKNIY